MQRILIWSFRYRRIHFVLMCFVFMFFYAMKVTYEDYVEFDAIFKHDDKMVVTSQEMSCYYMDDVKVFPSMEDPTFSPKDQSIFFIESACKEKMTMLQACVIESAAIAHPKSKIHVLFSYSITESPIKGYFEQLLNYSNVFAARIHIARYAKGTVLEPILIDDIKKSRYPIEDVTNILKIVTLHKWGGTVLSNDMMVMRALEDLPKNWVAKQNNGISSGILSFAKDDVGRNITSEIMKELAKSYDPKSGHFNRLETILNRVMKRRCPDLFKSKSGECIGLKVFPEDFFYPIRIPSPPVPYLDDSTESIQVDIPYTFHIKNMDYSSYSSEEWPAESLARIFCPSIYEFRLRIS